MSRARLLVLSPFKQQLPRYVNNKLGVCSWPIDAANKKRSYERREVVTDPHVA